MNKTADLRCLLVCTLLVCANGLAAPVTQVKDPAETAARLVARTPRMYLPLREVGSVAAEAENKELLTALAGVKAGGLAAAAPAMEDFLTAHTNSPWAPGLRVNLARHYREHGRYSDALRHYELAWRATREAMTADGKPVADFAFAHWTQLLANLGRKEALRALFQETQGRIFDGGPLQQMVNTTREALRFMLSDPGISFRCGTYALRNVAKALKGDTFETRVFDREPSPANGFTMTRLV